MNGFTHEVRFPSPLAPVVGAPDLSPGEFGVVARRLPAWTRPRITDPGFDFVVGMMSGVRVVTSTTADAIELEFAVTNIDPVTASPAPAVVDLVVDGVVRASATIAVDEQSLIDGTATIRQRRPPTRVRFDGLGTDPSSIELWLPHTTTAELVALRATAPLTAPDDRRPLWLHHGSSISQCGEALRPTGTWPSIAAREAGVRLRSLGFSGNAVGDPFVARTIRDEPADLISLEIGINIVNADLMRRRMFESVVHGFLDTVRDGHPTTPILLIGPIPCPAHEHHPGPTQLDPVTGQCTSVGDDRELERGAMSLDVVRDALASVIDRRADPLLGYLDGRILLPDAEVGDLDDGLHPNAAAYARMGTRFAEHALGPGGFLDPVRGA